MRRVGETYFITSKLMKKIERLENIFAIIFFINIFTLGILLVWLFVGGLTYELIIFLLIIGILTMSLIIISQNIDGKRSKLRMYRDLNNIKR